MNSSGNNTQRFGGMIIITGDSKVSDEEEEEIGDMINIVFGGIIIVTGTIGNLLSLIVLRTGDLKNLSTCFYMSMLAVADLGKCSIGTLSFFLWFMIFALVLFLFAQSKYSVKLGTSQSASLLAMKEDFGHFLNSIQNNQTMEFFPEISNSYFKLKLPPLASDKF